MDELDRDLREGALEAARAAAELHRREAGRLAPGQWTEKDAADFVTEVDREAERRIVRSLRARFPDHPILAEEGTQGPGAGAATRGSREGVRWIVDPLDGTTNWLHGYPEYAVSIAAVDGEGLRVGVVLNSATGETFDAVRGAGSRRDGEPIRTSQVAELRLALVGTGFPFKRLELLPPYLAMLERALAGTSGVRRAGAAALDLCDLACGRLDAFWELWLMPWDVAAGALVVREAGGWFAPLELEGPPPEGEAARTLEGAVAEARRFPGDGRLEAAPPAGGAYLASNGLLLEPVRALLAGVA